MKITNKWLSYETNVVSFKLAVSGNGNGREGTVDEGTIQYDETYEVPEDKLRGDPRDRYILTVTSVHENLGKFESVRLTKLSDVLISVTNPYQG